MQLLATVVCEPSQRERKKKGARRAYVVAWDVANFAEISRAALPTTSPQEVWPSHAPSDVVVVANEGVVVLDTETLGLRTFVSSPMSFLMDAALSPDRSKLVLVGQSEVQLLPVDVTRVARCRAELSRGGCGVLSLLLFLLFLLLFVAAAALGVAAQAHCMQHFGRHLWHVEPRQVLSEATSIAQESLPAVLAMARAGDLEQLRLTLTRAYAESYTDTLSDTLSDTFDQYTDQYTDQYYDGYGQYEHPTDPAYGQPQPPPEYYPSDKEL
ncbi:MAG: hypothetical protein MHM6MM_008274 [Cercozoa sp. M6MM]